MGTYFLTSGFPNGFTLDFSRQIKTYCNKSDNFLFIASDFNNYEKTDRHCRVFTDEFRKIGFNFKSISIIDDRIDKREMTDLIANADILWIAGGDTLLQIKNINDCNLRSAIADCKGIVIGMSAGSINMAKNVVLAKDVAENIPELFIYKGIGLVDINIEPHLDLNNKNHIEDISKASKYASIYGLFDESFIVVTDDKNIIYGDFKLFEKR